jgi:hypothetical protein
LLTRNSPEPRSPRKHAPRPRRRRHHHARHTGLLLRTQIHRRHGHPIQLPRPGPAEPTARKTIPLERQTFLTPTLRLPKCAVLPYRSLPLWWSFALLQLRSSDLGHLTRDPASAWHPAGSSGSLIGSERIPTVHVKRAAKMCLRIRLKQVQQRRQSLR